MSRGQVAHGLRHFAYHLLSAVGWAIGVFSIFNLFGEVVRPGFDANILWMPLQPTGWVGSKAILGAAGFLLVWSLMRPARSAWRYALTQALLLFLALNAAVDGVAYYRQLASGEIRSSIPFPFTWLIVIALGSQVWRVRRSASGASVPSGAYPATRVLATAAGVAAVIGAFLFGQFFLFGQTSHLRQADCIIVMGAGVTPDGGPSRSLYDRTRKGCDLYLTGLSRYLVFSGGPGRVGVTEPEVMLAVARRTGVPAQNCILDELGHSTYETVVSTRRIMEERGWRTALVVSHDYHLSRTWLTFRRAGVKAYTVPATRSRLLTKDVYYVFREAAAWMYYYVRPLWDPLPDLPS